MVDQKTTAAATGKNAIRPGSVIVDVVLYTIAILLALVTVYPLLFVLSNSISDPQTVLEGGVWLLPKGFSLDAYKFVLSSVALGRSFLNSVLYTVLITVVSLVNSMMCGFGLSKRGLLWRKGIVIYLVIPMWFTAGLIPTFVTITRLGLYNSLWAVFLPSFVSIYNIILARTFISSLPESLIEAAHIDGASVPKVFVSIVLPLSKPIMAVLGLYTALAVWNAWMPYLIYLPGKTENHPLQYFLVKVLLWGDTRRSLNLDSATSLSMEAMMEQLRAAAVMAQLKYAVVVVTTIPIMLVYPFIQKYFVQGVMLGSLKE